MQGVNDAKTLISKYLNKEAEYGGLLSKIADNEKAIENLKSESDELIEESKHLEMEREVLQSIKIKSQDLHGKIVLIQIHSSNSTLLTTRLPPRKTISTNSPSGCISS